MSDRESNLSFSRQRELLAQIRSHHDVIGIGKPEFEEQIIFTPVDLPAVVIYEGEVVRSSRVSRYLGQLTIDLGKHEGV